MADQTEAKSPPAAPAGPKPVATRGYTVVVRKSGTLEQLIESLKETIAEGATSEVTIKVGGAVANTPKVAMGRLAEHRDLKGDYEAVADGAFTKFVGISTETKRRVTGL